MLSVKAQDADSRRIAIIVHRERAFAEIFTEVGGIRAAAAVADNEDESAFQKRRPDRVSQSLQFLRIDATEF